MLARGAASTGQRRRRHSPFVERAEPAYRCDYGLHAPQPSTIAAVTQAGGGERQEGADAARKRSSASRTHSHGDGAGTCGMLMNDSTAVPTPSIS